MKREGRQASVDCGATPQIWTPSIIGITGDGYVPVVEDDGGPTGRSVVRLPSLAVDVAPPYDAEEIRERVSAGLRCEFGYELGELLPMGTRRLRGWGGPPFLLAPLLGVAGWRARVGFVPGVYEVALSAVPEWLRQRSLAGAVEAPGLREGLLLAQELFPRWARTRLSRALVALGGLERRAARSIPSA